jgi:hypothetical protein
MVSDGGRHPEMVDLRQAEAEKWRGTVKSVYMLSDPNPDSEWSTRLYVDGERVGLVVSVEDHYHGNLAGKTLAEVRAWAEGHGLKLEKTKH